MGYREKHTVAVKCGMCGNETKRSQLVTVNGRVMWVCPPHVPKGQFTKPVKRCDAQKKNGSVCDLPLDEHGYCDRPREHADG